jgi:Ti-type conjugative transfer relaxase TraA
MKPISRSSGRSAVAAAAYRSASCLMNERDGIVHDFTRKDGVEHCEIVLPEGSDAQWAYDRSRLWNAAEACEKRKDARVAREFEVALPHELDGTQRVALVKSFAQDLADRYGTAVDFALHMPQGHSDIRNHHAHIMMTTRSVKADGFGDKTNLERENAWLMSHSLPTSQMQLRTIREAWEHHANQHLAMAGVDVRIDHRSHADRGWEIEPTEHMGVHATGVQRRGGQVSRLRLDENSASRNADLVRQKPEQVLEIITQEKSVFNRHDVARTLHRYLGDDISVFQNAFAAVMASSALVELQPDQRDARGKPELARYSTVDMVTVEAQMSASALRMVETLSHRVSDTRVTAALAAQDKVIRANVASGVRERVQRGEISAEDGTRLVGTAGLSEEQRAAVRHITGPEQIAAVVGFAGAGKSTMLAAAREAWAAQGYRVHGAALAGKAAEGLEESSGIASRTLASWEHGWQNGHQMLAKNDVLVIDEAGMAGSRQLARFVATAEQAGAKLVLVGDHEQLQAIGAGAPFRALAEQTGFAQLQDVRRQREDWQRQASVSFASHKTTEALRLYADQGHVRFEADTGAARAAIVSAYLQDMAEWPEGSRIAMAHRRADVRALNEAIRSARQEQDALGQGEAQGEYAFTTRDGIRHFAPGDRIVFLENNRDLGVKNGMLGTVCHVEPDRIHIQPDGKDSLVSVSINDYAALDHGYATTIHKTQGATVDRAFVLASHTMDRHLTYVAMTRHRARVDLYTGKDAFADITALSARLSRAGLKETTLDYTHAFARMRGIEAEPNGTDIAEKLGINSEIVLERGVQETGVVAGVNVQPATAIDAVIALSQSAEISQQTGWETAQQHSAPRTGIGVEPSNRMEQNRKKALDSGRNKEYPPLAHYGAIEGRVRGEAGYSEPSSLPGREAEPYEPERVPPLLPAFTSYDHSAENVAWMQANRDAASEWVMARDCAAEVFTDADKVMSRIETRVEKGEDAAAIAARLRENPEQFGELRGKTGLFGGNRERKQARASIDRLEHRISQAGDKWQRSYKRALQQEKWQRANRDPVEVPGLTPRSAELLQTLLKQPYGTERDKLSDAMQQSPAGKQAFAEAEHLCQAMEKRLGPLWDSQFDQRLARYKTQLHHREQEFKAACKLARNTRDTIRDRQHEIKQEKTRKMDRGMRW